MSTTTGRCTNLKVLTPKYSKQMDSDPQFRKKHLAKDKKKDKGIVFASQKHIRIELENQWRHEKKTLNLKY